MYYDKKDLKDTPSILDGINVETERRYRKEGARFIMNCGTQMGLGHNTMATGVVYFHRFYMAHSFKSFPRYVTACCCLFLAGKVEETPKKCRDIIKTAKALLSENHFYSFGDDPKEEVMTLERILLQTIKFDLQVEHPYTFLLKYAKCLKGDQQKLQKMVQMAWNFVNDSLSTVVCLQWEPEIIAVALIHLASKLSKFAVVDWIGRQPHQSKWWDMFVADVTMDILEDICHQVLDLYQPNNQKEQIEQNSPPQKPISRADSPTLKVPNITIANSSPINKIRTANNTNNTNNNNNNNNNASGVQETEINNIQAIKTISTNSNMNIMSSNILNSSNIANNGDIVTSQTASAIAAVNAGSSNVPKMPPYHMGAAAAVPPPPPPPINPVLQSLYNNVQPQLLQMPPLPIQNYPTQANAWSHYANSTPSMATPSQGGGNGHQRGHYQPSMHVPPPPPPSHAAHQPPNYGRRF